MLAHLVQRCTTNLLRSQCRMVMRDVHRSFVQLTFVQRKERLQVKAPIGKTILEVALDNNIDIEGACGGELACSTCHVIFSKEVYDKLPPKVEEEDDMLDLAWGLTETSRLCCQIRVTPELDGVEVKVPEETNNMLDK